MATSRTLYDVLGVRPAASADEMRRSYLQRARLLHPDRHVDAGTARRAEVERQMQELNAAWDVLGDPRRRRRYDEQQGIGEPRATATAVDSEPRFVTRLDGTTEADVGPVDAVARLARGIPWIALIAVLVLIFIFSAYALTGGPTTGDIGNGTKTGTCVTLGANGTIASASCGTSGAHVVVTLVGPSSPCPQGTERFQPASGAAVYCLEG